MDCFMDGRHAGHQLLLWLIHELPVDDAKEGVHHQEEDELPTDELVQGALERGSSFFLKIPLVLTSC